MWQRRGLTVAAAGAAALAARYARGRARADREWRAVIAPRLTDLGEVTTLSVLPLVERLTAGAGLRGEPGVSYLIRADDTTMLFDCGLGLGRGRSALASNAETLGAPLADLDAIVVSAFGARYRTLRVGEELRIDRTSAPT